MKIRWLRFNIYLLAAVAVTCGCHTTSEKAQKKALSSLRLHLEVSQDGTQGNEPVSVCRSTPVLVNVDKMPFLTEANLSEAKVIDVIGGYALRLQMDHSGTSLLEMYTAANHGRRIAVFVQFGDELKERRWLAAPVIKQRISNGVFVFTPDASREEAEQIAQGLNNVVKKTRTWLDK